jgi:hypothetical protein
MIAFALSTSVPALTHRAKSINFASTWNTSPVQDLAARSRLPRVHGGPAMVLSRRNKSKHQTRSRSDKFPVPNRAGDRVNYHVIQARPVLNEISPNSHNAHLQVLLEYERGDSLVQTWATINVRAGQDEVFYTIDDDYRHPITNVILNAGLSQGFNKLDSKSGGVALDYIREKLVDITTMEKLQHV